jgi:lipoprotein-anchoring transpeptidase ErfK/SrfK
VNQEEKQTPKTQLIVRVHEQRMEFWHSGQPTCFYPISTSAHGVGSQPGSNQTPLGRHRIREKHGHGLPLGAVMKSRKWTGQIWMPGMAEGQTEDWITTRLLWLEGLEPDNLTSFDRYIYIHGTNHEDLLGKPASHGCIRMSNTDVLALFDACPEGTPVDILP